MGDRLRADAGFIIVWMLATMIGFFAGAYGGVVAAYTFSTGPTPLFAMPLIVYVWSGVGVAAGLLQWVVLRMRVKWRSGGYRPPFSAFSRDQSRV